MNADAKKTVLRMIPYGIYVLTADDGKGGVAAATVNFVTQTSFAPPLVAVGVKTDSGAYAVVKSARRFVLNMLDKDARARLRLLQARKTGRRQAIRPVVPAGGQWRPDPGCSGRRGGMPGEDDRRGRRSSHRGRGGDGGASAAPDHRPPRRGDPGDEGPRRQRLLRRLTANDVQ